MSNLQPISSEELVKFEEVRILTEGLRIIAFA